MDAKSSQVLKGLLALTEAQQKSVLDEYLRYAREGTSGKKVIIENVEKSIRAGISMGPTDTGCPCCGR